MSENVREMLEGVKDGSVSVDDAAAAAESCAV